MASVMGLCGGRGKEKRPRVEKQANVSDPHPRQRKVLIRQVNAMFVSIGKRETHFLELELAKLSGSTNSIHLLSALFLASSGHIQGKQHGSCHSQLI